MRCACRGHAVRSAVLDNGWMPLGPDGHPMSCGTSFDAPESQFHYSVTRAQIMDYLSQTYGPVFVEDLAKHLT
jgi:hypothetical protein